MGNEMPNDPVDFITKKLRETDLIDAGDKPQQKILQPEEIALPPVKAAEQPTGKSTKLDSGDVEVLRKKTREALCDASADGSLSRKMMPEESLRAKTRQALLDADADGSLQTKIESVRPFPFPAYYTKHFKGNAMAESLARRLFKLGRSSSNESALLPFEEVVVPPKA